MREPQHDEFVDEVDREVAKHGVNGTVVVVGGTLELQEARVGVPVSIDVALILEQWPLLPPDMQAQKVKEVTRRLLSARSSRPGRGAGFLDRRTQRRAALGVLGLFGLLFSIGLFRMLWPRFVSGPALPAAAPREPEAEQVARLARACDVVRERIRTNANFGPVALEGFVVELWLADKGGADLKGHPAITSLVANGKLAPTADERLAAVVGGRVTIEDGLDAETAARWRGWHAARIVFGDGLGRAFFEDENRAHFLGLADRVARATGATYGALTARCAHETARAVGAWFRGPDVPGAAAALVYQMGIFSDEKIIDPKAQRALAGAGGELEGLTRDAAKVEDLVAQTVGGAGGSLLAEPSSNPRSRQSTIEFALTAPSRSSSAARDLARRMGIAPASE